MNRDRRGSGLFALTIFVSAFLLFLVQPLIAKIILPWFGGTASVWTTCMLFFQVSLLLGYSYSFWLVGAWRTQRQVRVHLVLLGVSLLTLPILPGAAWKPSGADQPIAKILILLTVTVGIPYFVLSTTGPLLQAWYSRLNERRLPYRLYALSNAGSLLALIGYPAMVEPLLPASAQAYGWSALYGGFVLLCAGVAWLVIRSGASTPFPATPEADTPLPRLTEQILWIALAAIPSALLLSITNHLSQNIAPIPLLWVIPLGLYLLSLILCFDSDRWYHRRWCFPGALAGLAGMTYYLVPERVNTRIYIVVPVFVLGLFACCMACHGELSRRKPAALHLTRFYLMLSVGGALGGMFVALIAPFVFKSYLELPLSLLGCAVLLPLAIDGRGILGAQGWWPRARNVAAAAVALGLVYLITVNQYQWEKKQRLVTRNFYGQLRVEDKAHGDETVRHLFHGTIRHGSQLLSAQGRRRAIAYYSATSGVALAIVDRQATGPVRLGVIGLGSGTLATYGRPGDEVEFYEINPLVEQIARSQFTYLGDCRGKVRVALGDARRTLETQPPQNFDVLSVDAFSSDAIPVHLLTVEAFREYFRHLKPDGILAVHISNRYLNLEWVVRLAAQATGKAVLAVFDEDEKPDDVLSDSDWMLVSTNPHAFDASRWKDLGDAGERPKRLKLWTDEYSNLLAIVK